MTWEQVEAFVLTDRRVAVTDLTLEVVRGLDTGLEMHDAIITATAALLQDVVGEDIAVITRDKAIRESGLVQTVW